MRRTRQPNAIGRNPFHARSSGAADEWFSLGVKIHNGDSKSYRAGPVAGGRYWWTSASVLMPKRRSRKPDADCEFPLPNGPRQRRYTKNPDPRTDLTRCRALWLSSLAKSQSPKQGVRNPLSIRPSCRPV
ncbi:MAG TPA: hypothetical protein DCS07_02045 [Bdellovibrionales bacterium]|nr:hypothetical protein [Bdellovibrionales bacterium]